MNYIFFFQDIFINLLILFSSFFILIKINFLKNININEVVLIFFIHTFFMMLMIFYGTISPSDSNFYWNSVDNFDFENLLSSGFMKLLLIF